MLELEEKILQAELKSPEERTYEERYYVWLKERYQYQNYDEGEEVEIYDGDKLYHNELRDGFGEEFPEWVREYGKYFGKKVKQCETGEVKILVGISYTYMDYYYILDDNGKKSYETCLASIEILD